MFPHEELLLQFNPIEDRMVESGHSLYSLVMNTLTQEITDPWVLYTVLTTDSNEYYRGKMITASHQRFPGGYGQGNIALSPFGKNSVLLLSQTDHIVITTYEKDQTPLNAQRDALKLQMVWPFEREYYTINLMIVQLLIQQLTEDGAVNISSSTPVLPK